jgi:hypothetical protein
MHDVGAGSPRLSDVIPRRRFRPTRIPLFIEIYLLPRDFPCRVQGKPCLAQNKTEDLHEPSGEFLLEHRQAFEGFLAQFGQDI